MQINRLFFRIYLAGRELRPYRFLGTAFPIAPDGCLITCRHVVDIKKQADDVVVVLDAETNHDYPIDHIRYSVHPDVDIAFIPNAFRETREHFFPILSPEHILMGENVYSFGFYRAEGKVKPGYFKGNIVNLTSFKETPGVVGMSLSYAVIEGLSGSPVLTYHNGPKVVGLCYGSVQSRIAAHEIVEYQDEKREFRETITRVVEFGEAYHASTLVQFLEEVGAKGYIVSSERFHGVIED